MIHRRRPRFIRLNFFSSPGRTVGNIIIIGVIAVIRFIYLYARVGDLSKKKKNQKKPSNLVFRWNTTKCKSVNVFVRR